METQENIDHDLEKPPAATDYHSNIDSSRPFRSVREAVAIFGEKFLAGEIYTSKRFAFPQHETPCYYTPSPSPQQSQQTSWKSFASPQKSFDSIEQPMLMMESLKKLEAELEETKIELRRLKERESETEVAVASLNAELHKNMSKLARAEAAAAAASKASVSRSNSAVPERGINDQENGFAEDEKRRDLIVRLESSRTLAQVLNAGEQNHHVNEELFMGRMMKKDQKKMMKKKPIIPLVGDLFSRKKGNTTAIRNPLFSGSSGHLNLS